MTPRRSAGVTAVVVVALLSLAAGVPPTAHRAPGADDTSSTVTIYGRAGTFGSTGDAASSGQSLSRRAVPGWGFPAGQQAYRTARAGDGTVFMAGLNHNGGSADATSDQAVVALYRPDTNAFRTIPLRTSTGRDRATGRDGAPAAPSIVDLEPVAGGAAIAFTARPAGAGQDPAADGVWPAFGVLATVDGRWQLATGNDPTVDLPLCPDRAQGCGGLGELVVLPRSGDLVAAAELPAGAGRTQPVLVGLRLTGPDAGGRFDVRVTGLYPYPRITNPGGGESRLAVRALQADPTGVAGDERFAVSFEVTAAGAGSGPVVTAPGVVQEFGYDSRSGGIRPVSAPFLPGDRTANGARFFGYLATLYDADGNLWAARLDGLQSGRLGVYAAIDGVRASGGRCRFDPARSMDSYVTVAGGRTVWGAACRPDYDLVQTQDLLGIMGLVEDPASHDVVAVAFGGDLLAVRRSGAGRGLTFRLGTVVDLGRKQLPTAAGNILHYQVGAIGPDHRLWLAAVHSRPGSVRVPTDQWLYSIDVARLFDPAPVPISAVAGRTTTVQAEYTVTGSTTQHPGWGAVVNVVSDAHWRPCTDFVPNTGCAYDEAPGDGFVLADASGLGFLHGSVEYRIDVATAGDYRVAYRVSTLTQVSTAQIELTAAGRTYRTPVSTNGRWRTLSAPDLVTLPAGVQTIRIGVPPGGGGWSLNWFTLQRA